MFEFLVEHYPEVVLILTGQWIVFLILIRNLRIYLV